MVAALVASLALVWSAAEAGTKKSFSIVGAGIAPDGFPFPGSSAPHWADGLGTFLGKYTSEGAVLNDSIQFLPNGDATGTFQSDGLYVFTGEHGDELAVHYGDPKYGAQGTYQLIYLGGPVGPGGTYIAIFDAEFVPSGTDSTGKFKGVGGSWTMIAETEPFELGATDPIGYAWEGKGTLVFPR
jgi:hypothetical protein